MSKRGTNSAKFIGGKDWKNGHIKSTLKAHLKAVQKKNKKEYLKEAFNPEAVAFGFDATAPYVEQYRKYFVTLTSKFNQDLFFTECNSLYKLC